MYSFESDYLEGAHPKILEALLDTNLLQTEGYGTDALCEAARKKIREKADCPDAGIHFVVGGTQANLIVIAALLRPWEAALAADTAHIAAHESGSVEATGHKVITLKGENGKISAAQIETICETHFSSDIREHMPQPKLVYLSQPTEYGTLYSLKELEAIRCACDRFGLKLFVDGARLVYALGCPENDVSLPDLSRLCDAYYIGGTKAGCLFGETLVLKDKGIDIRCLIKQRGGLLAKGRLLGVQFGALFTDELYLEIGTRAVKLAGKIRDALTEHGIPLRVPSPTNQLFPIFTDQQLAALKKDFILSPWEDLPDGHRVMRICVGWAGDEAQVNALIEKIRTL